MNPTRRALLQVGALALASAATPQVFAREAFPSKPIRIIVPTAPGGSNDFMARLLAPHLSQTLGQPVVVENRGGAGGAIGSTQVARSAPDGHTALLYSNSILTLPALMSNPGFDINTDLIPVTMLMKSSAFLVVSESFPANTLEEFLKYVKTNDGQINFGSGGVGGSTHLMGEMFNKSAGTNMVHVPFKSAGEFKQALVAGQVHAAFDVLSSAKPLADSGRLKILATTSRERDPALPDVPSLHEGGLSGYEYLIWQGVFLPASTPNDVVQAWAEACQKAVNDPEIREKFVASGLTPVGSSSKEFAEIVQRDIPLLAKVIEDAGIPRQ